MVMIYRMHAFFKSGTVEPSIIVRVTAKDTVLHRRNQTERVHAVVPPTCGSKIDKANVCY